MPDEKSGETAAPLDTPGFTRRLLSLLYEALLATAVAFAATFVFLFAAHFAKAHFPRALLQAYLLLVGAVYFVPQWRRGQTLPMKTWGMRVATAGGARLTIRRALARYALAVPSCLLAGAGFLWALVDKDRQFLHDRLARTRLLRVPREGLSASPGRTSAPRQRRGK